MKFVIEREAVCEISLLTEVLICPPFLSSYLLLVVLAILWSVLSSAADSALVLRRCQVVGSPLQSFIPQEPHP